MIKGLVKLSMLATVLVWNNAIAEDSELAISENEPTIQYPYDCIESKKYPCSLQTKTGQKFKFELSPGIHLHLGSGTVILVKDSSNYALVMGELVVQTSKNSAIETEFADLQVQPGLYYLTAISDSGVFVSNLDGFVTFSSNGKANALKLEKGYAIEVSKVRKNGWFEFGFPQPAVYSETIRKLSKVMTLDKNEFFKMAREFQPVAREAVEQMSQYYHSFAERRISSHNENLELMKRRREQIQKMNSEMRAMFRKENYMQ
ncbi:MAG: hypothetical protein R2827_10240 [Bdellovibrionales bacterium]